MRKEDVPRAFELLVLAATVRAITGLPSDHHSSLRLFCLNLYLYNCPWDSVIRGLRLLVLEVGSLS